MAIDSFTNFCCRLGGSNLNAGTRTGNTTLPGTSADFTYASGTWVNATRVFTVASGNPQSDGVAVGDYIALDTTGSAPATFGGQVSAVSTTTITVHVTKNWGTNPANGTYTLRIGGAFQGPNGTAQFPLNINLTAATNTSGHPTRLNLVNDQTYSMTSGITFPSTSPAAAIVEGCSSAYGDDGIAVIDGGASGSSYVLLTLGASVGNACFKSIEFKNNGASGTSNLISLSNNTTTFVNCIVRDCRGSGITCSTTLLLNECELYGCNQSNTSNQGGVVGNGTLHSSYTIFHDITGSNSFSIRCGYFTLTYCIIDTIGSNGVTPTLGIGHLVNCDIYNNGDNGISTTLTVIAINCNIIKNGSTSGEYGINCSGSIIGFSKNCGYGTGTQANFAGDVNPSSNGWRDINPVNYASNLTPWNDPANGDFSIVLAAAKNAGRNNWTQTAASYTGTTSYPDIGVGQALGGIASVKFHPGMTGGCGA